MEVPLLLRLLATEVVITFFSGIAWLVLAFRESKLTKFLEVLISLGIIAIVITALLLIWKG